MHDFKNLLMYKKALELSRDIYMEIGDSRQYRIRDQLLGSVTSIGANLAEMASFDNKNQIKQKLRVCIGETNETEFWIGLLQEIGKISPENSKNYVGRLETIRIMLCNYLKKI